MADSLTLCTVCARAGSKGVSGKNLRKIGGLSLVRITLLQALKSGVCDMVTLSSDASSILDQARDLQVQRLYRPAELATDESGKVPVIVHATLESEARMGKEFDYVIDLDVTSPLRRPGDIAHALESLQVGNAKSLVTVTPSRRSPFFNLLSVDNNGSYQPFEKSDVFLRRQDVPKTFDMNASIYVWNRQTLISEKSVFTDNTQVMVMDEWQQFDVDSELDLEIVQYLFEKRGGELGIDFQK